MQQVPNYLRPSTGFPFSFGIFQNFYSTHPPFSEEASGIAVIGSTATVSDSYVQEYSNTQSTFRVSCT